MHFTTYSKLLSESIVTGAVDVSKIKYKISLRQKIMPDLNFIAT